ncbi:MAG: TonB-dependent receptor domain-containing protein, partial [Gemmatimonadales bacterium]
AQDTGRITGRLLDAESGTPITGGQVGVSGQALLTTGSDGRFVLQGVPVGSVDLRARMIGYQPKTVTGVVVSAGTTTEMDISMTARVLELEEITVTAAAERGTVQRALDDQRYASNIINVVTAEQIGKSPDGDAAQVVRRVSGVTIQDGRYVLVRGLGERYTITALNGTRIPSPEPERKVVPLDLFPSGILETITASKTFTPEQPGDFSGARVNLQTRTFPAAGLTRFSVSAGFNGAATGQTIIKPPTTGVEWLGSAGSDRRIPAPVAAAGDLRGVSPGELNSVIASFRDVWAARRGKGTANGSLGMALGGQRDVLDRPLGYLASFTYSYGQEVRTDEQRALATTGGPINVYRGSTGRSTVLWGGILNLSARLSDDSRISLNNTYTRSADNEATLLSGVNEEFQQFGDLAITRLTFTERWVRSNQLRGDHVLGPRSVIDWSVTSSGTRRYEPDRSDLIYEARVDTVTGEVVPVAWSDLRQSATRTFSDLHEDAVDLTGNFRYLLGDPSRHTAIKVGASWRGTNRDADSRAYDIRNLSLSEMELRQDPATVFGNVNANAGRLTLQANSNAGAYTAEERIGAAYAQLEIPLNDRLQMVGGARVENWDLKVRSRTVQGLDTLANPTSTDILPSVGLNLRLGETRNLRLSATQTLSRPEYREVAAVNSFDILGGLTLLGNPGLKRALVQNYDARWEWYPNPGEILSIGIFAKRFSHPIEKIVVAQTGASALSFVNAESANNYGVELEVRKSLAPLGEMFAPFSAFANTTLMRSTIQPGNDSLSSLTNDTRPMVGQSEYVINAGLTWSNDSGVNATVFYNVVGKRIAEAGVAPLPDTYEQARHLVDASIEFPMFRTASLKVDGRNLLDSPYRLTQGDVTRLTYRTGRVFSASVSWTP